MLKIAYHPIYKHNLPEGHRFPMDKYTLLPQQLLYEGTCIDENFFEPKIPNNKYIYLVHEPSYVSDLMNITLDQKSARKIGVPLSEELIAREMIIADGTIKASQYAIELGIAMNIAGGTHHAFTDRGEDFAAKVGTPIMATASGTVVESRRKGGNGNYVKIKHNNIYQTQYLHMRKRNVRVGQYVKQGDIIGWVGMTGNTSGPHVCYRFWKYGKQVDPFKQKLPPAKPLKKNLIPVYKKFITPLKNQLDKIEFPEKTIQLIAHN